MTRASAVTGTSGVVRATGFRDEILRIADAHLGAYGRLGELATGSYGRPPAQGDWLIAFNGGGGRYGGYTRYRLSADNKTLEHGKDLVDRSKFEKVSGAPDAALRALLAEDVLGWAAGHEALLAETMRVDRQGTTVTIRTSHGTATYNGATTELAWKPTKGEPESELAPDTRSVVEILVGRFLGYALPLGPDLLRYLREGRGG